ncbi:MAG: hypothetical protein HN368_06425, partial [Spirochaetales bacterium]|nr:hypothetical protein [Spirochaetales bacterium]
MAKRVLICHYRVGRTDGVSLEIDKRAHILREMRWEVSLLAGPGSDGADFVIPELDFDRSRARKIAVNAFGSLTDYENGQLLIDEIHSLSGIIEEKLSLIVNNIKPDFVLIHNIFSHGRHIASAQAFYNVL